MGHNPMTDPCDERYIYLHEWHKSMVNVGKYTVRPMDPIGILILFSEPSSSDWHLAQKVGRGCTWQRGMCQIQDPRKLRTASMPSPRKRARQETHKESSTCLMNHPIFGGKFYLHHVSTVCFLVHLDVLFTIDSHFSAIFYLFSDIPRWKNTVLAATFWRRRY